MPITASLLYRDSFNFMRNQFISILLLSLLVTFVTTVVGRVITPDITELKTLITLLQQQIQTGQSLPELSETQMLLVIKFWASLLVTHLANNTLLIGGTVTLAMLASQGDRVSAIQALGISAPMLPFLLMLLIADLVLTLLGTMILTPFIMFGMRSTIGMLLLVLPSIVITVALCLSPIILLVEKTTIWGAIRQSSKRVFANINLILPTMILWFLGKLILSPKVVDLQFSTILLAILVNLLTVFILIYLFRLYTLLRKED